MQRIHERQQLPTVGWVVRILAALEATLDLGHGPVVVGGHRAIVQASIAQRRIDELVSVGQLAVFWQQRWLMRGDSSGWEADKLM
jgi:hypothetical protein